MTNIFNKVYQKANGTLIGNWYEEQRLRDQTNVSRTIPSQHIPKRAMDFDTVISVDPSMKDNTFARIMGIRNDKEYLTTNSRYGDFAQPENKYKKIGINKRIYNGFFNCYVGNNNNTNANVNQQPFTSQSQTLFDSQQREKDNLIAYSRESLRRKVISAAMSKGWLGYRKFKLFLKSMSKKHDMYIHKEDLKYFFVNFGVCMEEKEVDYVYAYFQNSRNEINYEELLNSFIMITEERINMIHLFLNKLNQSKSLIKDVIINLLKPSIHPSVLNYQKTEKEIIIEYSFAFENRILITEDDFIQLFCEINTCVQDDKHFFDILVSCGFVPSQQSQ